MSTAMRSAESTLDGIRQLAGAGLPARELIEEAGRRIGRVVPSDGYFMAATDPQTSLCIGAGIVENLPEELCQPTWDYEFQVPDYLKFNDIARSGRPVADIHEATGGRPERSPRWREYAPATGFRSEVRATFSLGEAVWGIAQFDRSGDASAFTEEEKAWLARVAPIVAGGLRQAMLAQPSAGAAVRGPGIVLLDQAGRLVSATREALEWFEEIDTAFNIPSLTGVSMPFGAYVYASSLRGAAGGEPPARARLRTRSGVWLLLHGSQLQGTDQLALIVEPAKAADVAPLIVEAYGFTQRELEVTRMIARGLGTSQIAASLFLSPHTVRDHVKSVFEKVGVSSRGELVAKVFADHYATIPHI